MANIELLLLITVGAAILAYFLTKLNTMLGSVLTIFTAMFVFISLITFGVNQTYDLTVNVIPILQLDATYLGTYIAIIISFVYLMVSFFHPYFLDKYKYKNAYNFLFLLSLAGVIGIFFTDNFLQLFFGFELIIWTSMLLIPTGRHRSSAVSYYGFSAAGSFALLFGILIMNANVGSFNIDAGLASLSGTTGIIVFVAFIIAALAKLGSFPLHIWLPKAYTDAPDHLTPLLSGALAKLGAFVAVLALIKITPLTQVIEAINIPIGQYIIAILGSLTIIFGTLMAIKEDDAKKLLAYSSMAHGGYILVAFSLMSSIAYAGGLYHILAHALASAGAFLAIAAVTRQTGTSKMSELGGMIHKMPITYIVYLVAIISMAGIPPMGGFISKWLIFQAVINNGMIFVAIAVFFGSIGSFLYVFRPLAALFLGQELREYKVKVTEAPLLMLLPMIIITALNVYTGVIPSAILNFTNNILVELGAAPITITMWEITGNNGVLNPGLIALVFAIGVGVAFIIFILLKKSKQVTLMETYTAANFVHNEQLLHYTKDFYAPLERLYEKQSTKMQTFYKSLSNKITELGRLGKYLFMNKNVGVTILWIIAILVFLLVGEVL